MSTPAFLTQECNFRETTRTKEHKVQPGLACWNSVPLSRWFPEDGTQVPKHVGFDAYHELYPIQCICWLIYFFPHYLPWASPVPKLSIFSKILSSHRDTGFSIFILTEKHWTVHIKMTDATPNPPDKVSIHVSVRRIQKWQQYDALVPHTGTCFVALISSSSSSS